MNASDNPTLSYSMLLIKLVSTARTGYFYTAKKNRLYPTFSITKYDPIGMYPTFFFFLFLPLSLFLSLSPLVFMLCKFIYTLLRCLHSHSFLVKRHVLFIEQKMR